MREIEFYLPLTFLVLQSRRRRRRRADRARRPALDRPVPVLPLFNRDRLRVGDLLAGTWVVNAPKRKLSVDALAPASAPRAGRPASPTPSSTSTASTSCRRWSRCCATTTAKTIATVAATIRHKIGIGRRAAPTATSCVAYYDAARARMERGLLFGKRREDKFEPAPSRRAAPAIRSASANSAGSTWRPRPRHFRRPAPGARRRRSPRRRWARAAPRRARTGRG